MKLLSFAQLRSILILSLVVVGLIAMRAAPRAEPCSLPGAPGDDPIPATATEPAASADSVKRVYVFYDGSGSMAGYASARLPATPQARAYVDLATGLPQILSLAFPAEVRLHRFGRAIHPISDAEIAKLGQEGSYLCKGCDIEESRIDKILTQAALGSSNELFIVFTDLFLTEQHLIRSASAALHGPITEILRSGRSIGLLGVRSGFLGTIHDLPSGGKYQGAKERPFYVLLIGPAPAIQHLQRRLAVDYLRDLPSDAHRFVLFTTKVVQKPLEGASWPRDAFALADGAQPAALLHRQEQEELQQFRIAGVFAPPEANIPIAPALTPFAAVPSAFDIRQQVWLRLDSASATTCATWHSLNQRSPLLAIQPDDDAIRLQFGSPTAMRELPPRKVYLFRFDVRVTQIQVDSASMRWLRDWSFDASDEAALLAKKPTFFPTLHLRRLAETMTAIVHDVFVPQPLLRFGLVAPYR